jgi:hypothetical protein
LNFFNDHTSSLIERLIDTTHAVTGSGDFATENGLDEGWLGEELKSVIESSGGRHDLSSSSVDSVSVEFAVNDVEPHSSHAFLCEDTLFGGVLEG